MSVNNGSTLQDRFLSSRELEKVTGLSHRFWVNRRMTGDTPPYSKLSQNCVRYRWADVEKWLEEQKIRNTSAGTN